MPAKLRNGLLPATIRNGLLPATIRNGLLPATIRNGLLPAKIRNGLYVVNDLTHGLSLTFDSGPPGFMVGMALLAPLRL